MIFIWNQFGKGDKETNPSGSEVCWLRSNTMRYSQLLGKKCWDYTNIHHRRLTFCGLLNIKKSFIPKCPPRHRERLFSKESLSFIWKRHHCSDFWAEMKLVNWRYGQHFPPSMFCVMKQEFIQPLLSTQAVKWSQGETDLCLIYASQKVMWALDSQVVIACQGQ